MRKYNFTEEEIELLQKNGFRELTVQVCLAIQDGRLTRKDISKYHYLREKLNQIINKQQESDDESEL